MEQTKADLWSLGTTPTVTSFFELLLIDGHSPSTDLVKAPVTTGKCGLGWSFIFQATDGGTDGLLWGTATIHTLFTISLLATHHISGLDKLMITVEANSISEKTVHASEISLSDSKAIPIVSILSLANFTGNITIEIHVGLPKTFSHMGYPSGAEQKLHSLLAQSLLVEGLGDLTFALFTRVGHDVTNTRLLYAKSSLIRGYSTYIDNLFSDTKEREVMTVGNLAPPVYNAYDYTSDSDLESDSDVDEHEDHNSQLCRSGPSSTNVASQNQEAPAQPECQKLDDHESVILIRDIAYLTWKALIFYLYTREIYFKPLTSSSAIRDAGHRIPNVSCSPKSMFRLATKIGSEELQKLSLKAIIRGISKDNVVEELFSRFTSMYPEVQKTQVQVLIPLLKDHSVAQKLVDKMKDITIQGVPHLGATIASIIGCLAELAANWNEDQPLGDKKDDDDDDDDDNGGDEGDDDGDDDNSDDKKKKKRNDFNVKKRKDKDKDGKPSEGEKSKVGKGDKNESKPREGDKNKHKSVEGDKTKPKLGEGKYWNLKLGPSGDEEADGPLHGFTFVGRSKV